MSISIQKVSPAVGAMVKGVDLSGLVPPDIFETLEGAIAEHGVLVFRDQHLTPAQHVAFSRRFGSLETHVISEALLEGYPEIYVISNAVEDGKPKGRAYAGTYWHSDLSYMPVPAMGSMMYALQIPEIGGDTMFANMYLAYETLSEGLQRMLAQLWAVHDFGHADKRYFSKRGATARLNESARKKTPPVEHPVVRTQPATGRNALFINPGFTSRFVDMTEEESEPLLEYLFQHITQPAFIYRHRWQVNDLVFWDNRCTIHHAIRDYGEDTPRHMHRTTICGDKPFLSNFNAV